MSEDIKNDDVVPAILSEGEAIIPAEVAEKAAEIVAEIVETSKPELAEQAKAKESDSDKAPVDVITGVSGGTGSEKQALTPVADGVIGTGTVKAAKKPAAKPAETKGDTVAIHSSRNVHWEGVGKVFRGFNIVSKDAADKWLTRNHVRIATPAEVAKEYNN